MQQLSSRVRLDVTCLADVEEKEVKWLWEPYIPKGKITLLEGDPEAGKTFLSLEIAAAVTTGRVRQPFDCRTDVETCEPANVLFLAAEDDLADTIKPRFRQAKGDSLRFYSLNGVIQKQENNDVELGVTLSNIEVLDEAMKRFTPGLMVVDPFQAFVGSKVDFHRANEVRPVMTGLKKLAEKHDCAIMLIRHLAKAAYGKSIYRGIGSIDIIASARSVLMAGINPRPANLEDLFNVMPNTGEVKPGSDSRFALVHTKSNIAKKGPAITYSIQDGRLVFGDMEDISAEELMKGPTEQRRPRRSASQFLLEFLANGPKLSSEVYSAAAQLGIAVSTLNRASQELNVIKHPGGFGQSWLWMLTPQCETVGMDSSLDTKSNSGEILNEVSSSANKTPEFIY